jgi:DNA-binding CsgD family transcriptional regulator
VSVREDERRSGVAAVGVTHAEESVYLELCRMGTATTGGLAATLDMPPAVVLQVLAGLQSRALVRRTASGGSAHPAGLVAGAPDGWMAAAPDVAFERLLAEREQDERRLHAGITRLLEGYHRERGQRDPGAADLVEVVTGREAIAELWLSLLAGAREVVSVLDKPPFVQLDEVGPELEVLGRGVQVRSVYERATLLRPGRLALIQSLVAAGESAVMVAEVPFKLALVDRRWALLPVAPGSELSGALIVRPSPLLDALIQTFETQWSRAMPVPSPTRRIDLAGNGAASGTPSPGAGKSTGRANGRTGVPAESTVVDLADPATYPDPDTCELLTMLAAGMTDDGIARQLRVSARTVQRRVSELMEDLGARNRFQAGVQAARRGLL